MSKKRDGGANYSFLIQNQPAKRMGAKDFANMPDKPIMVDYSKDQEYRDGIINSFASTIKDLSGISENQR